VTPKICPQCGLAGDHTLPGEGSIMLHPRELAEILETAKLKQTTANKPVIEYTPSRTASMKRPAPQWAMCFLYAYRHKLVGPVTIECKRCQAKPGEWCIMNGAHKRNFVHDIRRFEQAGIRR
jgi:hypothetical protein